MDKKYKIVIFDLIDTLANSEGILKSTEKLDACVGGAMVDFLIDKGGIDIQKTADAVVDRAKKFKDITLTEEESIREWLKPDVSSLLPGAVEILKYLKDEGYLIGIISNSPPTFQNRTKDLGIDQYISFELYSYECGYRKPSKEIYDVFLNKAHIAPKDAVMVGDSFKNDVLGAQLAGLDAIFLTTELSEYVPSVKNLIELKTIL